MTESAWVGRGVALAAVLWVWAVPVRAQSPDTVRLTLAEALGQAVERSEAVAIARAAIRSAAGQYGQTRSALLPQLAGLLTYTRTLESQFRGAGVPDTLPGGMPSSECGPYIPVPGDPVEARLDSMSKALVCFQFGGIGFQGLGSVGLGAEHIYTAGVTFSQTIWAGGRNWDRLSAASEYRKVADLGLTASEAQLALDVTGAYYGVLLAAQLVRIARQELDQAQAALEVIEQTNQAGLRSDFDLLRARVARDNQRPVLLQREAELDIAVLRLKQLINLPPRTPVALAGDLDSIPASLPSELTGIVEHGRGVEAGDTGAAVRTPVLQAAHRVRAAEDLREAAASARWPSVVLTSRYTRLAYPPAGIPDMRHLPTDWTVGLSVEFPIFLGGSISAGLTEATAELDRARAQLEQTREFAAMDALEALDLLRTARASWEAVAGTVGQAQEAYRIAVVRYEQGLSTFVELNDTRLALAQAEVNRARAARDVQVARARVLLLPFLPIAGTITAAGSAVGTSGQPAAPGLRGTAGAGIPMEGTGTQVPTEGSGTRVPAGGTGTRVPAGSGATGAPTGGASTGTIGPGDPTGR